ncbi:MAG: LppX_LprAFG lipoprotein [Chloroflexia bacterium]|nr:LppX_LprAFG lipoprotein [Chloroflexia bacterium]
MPLPTFSRRRLLATTTLAPLAALLTGCGADPAPPTPTAAPTATPEELLTRASERLAATPSVGFSLDIAGDTFVDPNQTIRLLSATGDLLRPDSVQTEFQAEVVGRAITLQLITIGDQTWLTNILTGEWGAAPTEFAYRPDVLFDTQDGIGPVMGRVDNVETLADEEIDGRAAAHLRAAVDESVIGPLTYFTLQGSPVVVDLWIDKETDDLLRAQLTEPPAADKPNPAVWTLDLSDHGEQVTIEPPPES